MAARDQATPTRRGEAFFWGTAPDSAADPLKLIDSVQQRGVEFRMTNERTNENQLQPLEARASADQRRREYKAFFDTAPVGGLLVDQQGTIREANRAAADLLKASRRELAGRSLAAFIHPDARRRFRRQVLSRLSGGQPIGADIELLARDGRRFMAHLQCQTGGRRASAGDCIHLSLVDISREITRDKDLALLNACLEVAATATARQPLLDAFVAALKTYLECDAVGIRLAAKDGRMVYQSYRGFSRRVLDKACAPACQATPCLCRHVMQGPPSSAKLPFSSSGSFFCNASSRLATTLAPDRFGPHCTVCRAYGYESVALLPIRSAKQIIGLIHMADRREDRFPPEVQGMLENTSQRLGMALDRLHIQTTLDHTISELHHLSFKLIQAQEDEQRRIAMELHDQTGQDLSVLKLRLVDIHHDLLAQAPDKADKCREAESFIDKIIEDVRRLSHGLSPAALDILGLAAAVDAMVTDFVRHVKWEARLDVATLDYIPDLPAQIAVYRIIQEALHNTYKHAGASTVAIRSRRQKNHLLIDINDNGCGFDRLSRQKSNDRPQGLGLAAMRLRARMIGARFAYTSRPGEGAHIRIELPLDRRKDTP